jgi:peroxiredoxin
MPPKMKEQSEVPYYRIYKCFLAVILLTFFSLSAAKGDETLFKKMLEPGSSAPVNKLKDAMSKSEFIFPEKGKWNIVFYWSLFCHSCLSEIPAIQRHLPDNSDYNVYYVSLDSSRMEKGLENFGKKRRLTRPILMEELHEERYLTADQWGVSATPAVFITNPEGKIAFSHAGPMDIDKFFADFEVMKNLGSEREQQ